MARNKRAMGVNDLLKKSFITLGFEDDWLLSFGEVEQNFKMLVYGDSGNGKTEFVVMFAKYLTQFGKVYFNSFEQGLSKSLQAAFIRQEMGDVAGRLILGNKDSFEDLKRRMGSRNSPQFCIIDSLDYMNLTAEQYKELIEAHPKKSFIIICWSAGKHPKTQSGKDIEYMADIKVRVHEYKAYIRSRFGGSQPYVIWKEYWKKKRAAAKEAAANAKQNKGQTSMTL